METINPFYLYYFDGIRVKAFKVEQNRRGD